MKKSICIRSTFTSIIPFILSSINKYETQLYDTLEYWFGDGENMRCVKPAPCKKLIKSSKKLLKPTKIHWTTKNAVCVRTGNRWDEEVLCTLAALTPQLSFNTTSKKWRNKYDWKRLTFHAFFEPFQVSL